MCLQRSLIKWSRHILLSNLNHKSSGQKLKTCNFNIICIKHKFFYPSILAAHFFCERKKFLQKHEKKNNKFINKKKT